MKNYHKFVEDKGKFVNVEYKIIIKDLNDEPTTLITDFKIIKAENCRLEIKGKGYIKTYLNGYNKSNKSTWCEFDDFEDNKTRTIWNKNVENGTKRIKVYN